MKTSLFLVTRMPCSIDMLRLSWKWAFFPYPQLYFPTPHEPGWIQYSLHSDTFITLSLLKLLVSLFMLLFHWFTKSSSLVVTLVTRDSLVFLLVVMHTH